MDLLELKDKRNKLIVDMRVVNDRSTGSTEHDGFANAEDRSQYERMEADIAVLDRQIKRVEALEEQERSTAQLNFESSQQTPANASEVYERSFDKWLRWKEGNFTQQERSVFQQIQSRAQEVGTPGTGTKGGILVPTTLFGQIDKAMKAYGGVLSVANVMTTNSGNPMTFPTFDDTANKSSIVAEGTDIGSGTDLTFGKVTLTSFKYKTGWILVNQELIEDADFDISAEVTNAIIERNSRGYNYHLTVGTGSGQPQGVITGAAAGVSAAATALTGDNILNLIHSINSAYRTSPNFRLMFNDQTLLTLRKLKDSNNNYIFNQGLAGSYPDTIGGVKFVINDDMADIGASAVSVIAGDFSKYRVRFSGAPRLIRANELFSGTDQVGYNYFQRMDAKVINSAAIKKITHAAS